MRFVGTGAIKSIQRGSLTAAAVATITRVNPDKTFISQGLGTGSGAANAVYLSSATTVTGTNAGGGTVYFEVVEFY